MWTKVLFRLAWHISTCFHLTPGRPIEDAKTTVGGRHPMAASLTKQSHRRAVTTVDYGQQIIDREWSFWFIALPTIISLCCKVFVMDCNTSDTSLRSLHAALEWCRCWQVLDFKIAQSGVTTILNGTSVVECSIVKFSSTNVKLDTAQTSIFNMHWEKALVKWQLIEEWYAPCTVYCEWEQEYEF